MAQIAPAIARQVIEEVIPRVGHLGVWLETSLRKVDNPLRLVNISEAWCRYRAWEHRAPAPLPEKAFIEWLGIMGFETYFDEDNEGWIVGAKWVNDNFDRLREPASTRGDCPLSQLKKMNGNSVPTLSELGRVLGLTPARLNYHRYRNPKVVREIERVVSRKF